MKKINGNVLVIKEINISIVRNALKSLKNATKAQIAKHTGLTSATVGTMLQTLIKNGEIQESNKVQSNGGRPAQEFSYNFDYMNALIIYPFEVDEKTKLSIDVINLEGKSINNEIIEIEKINLDQLKTIVNRKIKEFHKIKQIALGNPGVNLEGKIILSYYDELIDCDLTREFNIPIVVENSVNLAVTGFKKRRCEDKTTWAYFFFSKNFKPKAGILINGNIHRGSNNYAGEISYLSDIDWSEKLYNNFEKFCTNISKVINTTSCLLNPDFIILAGDLLNEEHVEFIKNNCRNNLIEDMMPNIFLSKNFYFDCKEGLIIKTLEALVPDISITRS